MQLKWRCDAYFMARSFFRLCLSVFPFERAWPMWHPMRNPIAHITWDFVSVLLMNWMDGWRRMEWTGFDGLHFWILNMRRKWERERGTNNGWELELLMPDNGESNDMMNLIRSSKILIEWLNSANTFQVTCILCQWIEEEPLNCSIEWVLAYEKKMDPVWMNWNHNWFEWSSSNG